MDGVSTAASLTATGNSPAPFLSKTYDMVDDPSTDAVVSWSDGNNSFVVWNVPELTRDLLPKYFKHSNYSSFVRQLNTYGFRKVDPDRWEFANEGFLRGPKHLLMNISRRKPAHVHSQQQQQQPQMQSTKVKSCVEVGKFGLEEEVERLKRDKNVLMQELVRLRQQQQGTDLQLQTVGQRVQVMEQRQQQMMSFLAKAVQSPDFLAQLVHQQNDPKARLVGSTKKRRFSKQDDDDSGGEYVTGDVNGGIVKYQSLMNEAAKAMLRQILKMNTSPPLDQTIKNLDAFLIDDVPTPYNTLEDGGNPLRQNSGVTLSEVPLTIDQSIFITDSGAPLYNLPAVIPEIQSPPQLGNEPSITPQFPQINPENSGENMILQETNPGNIPVSEIGDEECMNGTLPIEVEDFSLEPEIDIMLDENYRLPGIDDIFWEQFLNTSSPNGETDDIDSSEFEGGVLQDQEFKPVPDNGWSNTHHMDYLTEQMGLLASEAKRG